MSVELADVRTFLTVTEELHFGRSAERLRVSPARVTQRIQALERHVGGALFERTSRRVVLTPLGRQLHDGLRLAHDQFTATMAAASAAARATTGLLRIGFTMTTGGEELNELVRAAEHAYPEIEVRLCEVPLDTPLEALRRNEVDVLINWLRFDAPDLTLGPALTEREMVLMVAADHPLADRPNVCIEDLADYDLCDMPTLRRHCGEPLFIPAHTPSGRPLRLRPIASMGEVFSLVAWGKLIHVTVASMRHLFSRPDLVFVPIGDLPPVKLGLIWQTAHENARIRALANLATSHQP